MNAPVPYAQPSPRRRRSLAIEDNVVSIAELAGVVAPPARPKETGDLRTWRAIEQELGTALPPDYRDFAMTYGSGTFCDPGRLCVSIMNPFSPDYKKHFFSERQTLLLTQGSSRAEDWAYDAFPESPGLFPLGSDDNGCTLLWLTEGQPDGWPIVLQPSRSTYLERVDLSMTTFLARAFSKQLTCCIWSAPEFFSGPRRVKFAQEASEIEYQ